MYTLWIYSSVDTDDEWKNIKDIVIKATEEVVGQRIDLKKWKFDQEC